MTANPNFKDLLNEFNTRGVKYLVVGGYAVMLYSEPRFTKDLDIWIEATPPNAVAAYTALAAFGAPLSGISAEELARPDVIYQLGIPPSRIDILTSVTGVEFAEAWERRTSSALAGVDAPFISIQDLIVNKMSVGRTSDLLDCERLADANRGPSTKQ